MTDTICNIFRSIADLILRIFRRRDLAVVHQIFKLIL